MRIRDYKLFLEINQDINFIYQKYTDIDNDDISVTIRNSMKHIGLFESFHTDEKVGKEFWFEYHCWENEKSVDAEIWKHTHQKVTVLSISEYSHENLEDRISDGNPRTYKVRFEDGFECDVFEDELLNNPEEYNRPDLVLEYVSESLKYLNINNINDYIFYQIPFQFFKEGKCIKGDDDYVLCFSSNFVYDYITDDDIEKALKQDLSKIDVSKDWTFYNNKNYENAYTDKSKHVLRIAKLVNEIKNGNEIVPISMFFDERSYVSDIKNYIEDGNHRIRALQYLKYDYFPAYVYGNFTKYLIKELV